MGECSLGLPSWNKDVIIIIIIIIITACLWNTLPFVGRDASSWHIFKKNLNELYISLW